VGGRHVQGNVVPRLQRMEGCIYRRYDNNNNNNNNNNMMTTHEQVLPIQSVLSTFSALQLDKD